MTDQPKFTQKFLKLSYIGIGLFIVVVSIFYIFPIAMLLNASLKTIDRVYRKSGQLDAIVSYRKLSKRPAAKRLCPVVF